jgi:zinc transporter, ZIP family
VSLSRTLLLGSIAGATILIGLPVGRLRRPAPTTRAMLNATAIGILLFLLWDVLSAAWTPIDTALAQIAAHRGGGGALAGYGFLFAAGLSVGLLGLVAYERWMSGLGRRFGPGTMSTGELTAHRGGIALWSPGRRLALLIAVGIGLHNFAEGLAIGQSAASGEIALATLLVVGFGLHNATEGFGIVAPLAADIPVPAEGPADGGGPADEGAHRPSRRFLLALGAIGGGPTFIGTAAGYAFTSEPLSVVFLTLAAGSILYVVLQLVGVAGRARRPDLLAYGVLLGLLAGFLTDAIVTAGGA